MDQFIHLCSSQNRFIYVSLLEAKVKNASRNLQVSSPSHAHGQESKKNRPSWPATLKEDRHYSWARTYVVQKNCDIVSITRKQRFSEINCKILNMEETEKMDWHRKSLEIDWSSAVSESDTICDVQFDQRITLTYLQAPPKAIQDMTAGKDQWYNARNSASRVELNHRSKHRSSGTTRIKSYLLSTCNRQKQDFLRTIATRQKEKRGKTKKNWRDMESPAPASQHSLNLIPTLFGSRKFGEELVFAIGSSAGLKTRGEQTTRWRRRRRRRRKRIEMTRKIFRSHSRSLYTSSSHVWCQLSQTTS